MKSIKSQVEIKKMSTGRAKILIVDDLPENLYAMKVTLAPLEIEMHTASSGNQALELMLNHEFAVVLLDVQMPNMDGFELANLMQNNQSTRSVPIIFITALSKEREHVFKGYEAGAVDYLFKPVNPDILLNKVSVFIKLYNSKIECETMHDEVQKARNLESLGLLAGGIAHDFNNILAAILGNVELVKLNISQEDQQNQELLANVEKASLRAKDLTNQLLTFSKGGDPVKSVTSVGSIVEDSANFVLHGSNVSCVYNFENNLRPAIIDKGQVGQVVQNIVLNAVQEMPDGGIIEVDCNNFIKDDSHIIPLNNGDYIEIKIKDSGPGIPPDLMDKIFDPYMTTKEEGSGLGLSISKSIAKKHEGQILVESDPGVGSTFFIYFPASDSEPLPTDDVSTEEESIRNIKILVMDDDPMIRKVSESMLSRLGHEVVLAESGMEAIQKYIDADESKEPVDIIIMDLTIPGGMGGEEACERIHSINPEALIIVSSGYSNDPVVANYQEYGFCASIEKPFTLQDIRTTISKVVS